MIPTIDFFIYILHIEIKNVKQVEFHAEALSISRLGELVISESAIITLHQHSFKSSMVDTPSVSVAIENAQKLTIKPKAFQALGASYPQI